MQKNQKWQTDGSSVQTQETSKRKEEDMFLDALKDVSRGVSKMVRSGIDSVFRTIFEHPISFQTFLKDSGRSFDQFILDIGRREKLHYIAGKLILEFPDTSEGEPLDVPKVKMTADFYFQNLSKKWILKEKVIRVDRNSFSDWKEDPDLQELWEKGRLEYPINPPPKGV